MRRKEDRTSRILELLVKGKKLEVAELSEHLITMPLHMWLTDEDVKKIIAITNEFV